MNKIGSSTLMLVVTCGKLKDYFKEFMDSVNPEFPTSESENEFNRTAHFFPSSLRLALGQWPLEFTLLGL